MEYLMPAIIGSALILVCYIAHRLWLVYLQHNLEQTQPDITDDPTWWDEAQARAQREDPQNG